MKNILKSIPVFLLLLLISKFGNAQGYDTYETYNSQMVQVSGNTRIESRLKKTVLVLSHSNQLNVKINIPHHAVNDMPEDNSMLFDPGLPFDLKMTIDPWRIENEINLHKVFSTEGLVTMNNITKAVRVEYIPMPGDLDQNDKFNLSLTIRFNAADFNMDTPYNNSHFIIIISDATVNRV